MDTIQKQQHIGVYGLIEEGSDILVINKSRGPYKGLYDLPGGRPFHGESLMKALWREIKEETGLDTRNYSFFGNYSFLTPYEDEGRKKELHHIALTYRVKDFEVDTHNPTIVDEDVSGSIWMNQRNLVKVNCSPLLWSIVESYEYRVYNSNVS